ncbi:MAG: BMP family ABC transporter substrate-binding protein, partial [Acidimicrobiia bacterium]
VSRSMREIVEHQLADDVGLADLGEHRLRDLDRNEHVFQLTYRGLPADFPPLSTMSDTPHNLPAEVNSFVGREREVEEIRSLLASSRLVTLLGIGGVGKSRLAVRAARLLTDTFRDGTWLVDLSGVSDPAHVAAAVGSIWDLPPEQDGSVQALCSFLRDQQLLIVLDNCEAVVEGTALLAEELLAAVSELRILATSREPLESQGEVLWRVAPLELPSELHTELSVDDLVAFAAVRLFHDRASSVVPGFQLDRESAVRAARICGLLDGVPLAIELAAARVRNMTLTEIEAGLDDRFALLVGGARATPSRHRALEATIDWSYELLDPQEQELFGRLGVFRRSFPLAGAEVVCGGEGIDDAEVRDVLGRLVDKSLLIREERDGQTWYELLDSLRRYAHEKIARGYAPLNERGFLLRLAQRTDPRLRGPEDRMWSVLLEGERHAVRTALELAANSWRDDQGSFLAGVAAASVTRTGRLGFLGGMSPEPRGGWLATNKHLPVREVMARFRNGFVAGARHVDPNLEVHETYLTEQDDIVSAFEDPSHGREAASELYSKGCDVVLHAAGQSGNRIFEAARRMSEDTDTHRWGIGADYDEYLIQPDQLKPHVLTSVVKQVPIDVLLEIKNAVMSGDPQQAPQFDLSNEGVRLSTSGGHLEGVAATLEDLQEQIMSGEIDVSESAPSE